MCSFYTVGTLIRPIAAILNLGACRRHPRILQYSFWIWYKRKLTPTLRDLDPVKQVMPMDN